MPDTTDTRFERVWVISGLALIGLFFLRQAGMVFLGAITGFGMYVSLIALFLYYPKLKKFLFSLGGIFDLAVSFGLPITICTVLGITGGTMFIATMTCGLLFTFTIVMDKLGGPVEAVRKTSRMFGRGAHHHYLEMKHGSSRDSEVRRQIGGTGWARCTDSRQHLQFPQEQEGIGRMPRTAPRRKGAVHRRPNLLTLEYNRKFRL